jgi:hypothetical protein
MPLFGSILAVLEVAVTRFGYAVVVDVNHVI